MRHRRRQWRRIDRRHHGRRAFRLRREHHRRADRVRPVEPDEHRPHRPRSRHHHRCPLSFRARRRSGIHGRRHGAGDRTGARFLRRHAHRARDCRLPGLRAEGDFLPLLRGQAADRHRGSGAGVDRDPQAPRLRRQRLRRRGRRLGAVLADVRRRGQGRPRRGSHAHPRRGQHRSAAAAEPWRRQRARS